MLNIVDWNVSVIIPNAMNIKLQYKRAGLSNTLCISDLEWTTLFGGDLSPPYQISLKWGFTA